MSIKQYFRKKDDRGVAMMVCITIIAVLMIFCFSLLSVAYSLYSSQNNSMQADRNAEAAKSLSMAIREELTAGSESSNMCKYIRYNIVSGNDAYESNNFVKGESWPHYDPADKSGRYDEVNAKRYFKLMKSDSASINGIPSNTEVCMWWTKPGTSVNDSDKTRLYVEVECRSGSQSYVVCSVYELYEYADLGRSSYNRTLPKQNGFNPGGNYIDKRYIWKWRFVGCE